MAGRLALVVGLVAAIGCGDEPAAAGAGTGGGEGGSGGQGGAPGPIGWPDSPSAYCSDGASELASCPTSPSDPAYGQDGSYLISVPSYQVGDGTVRDSVTGLRWQEQPSQGASSWEQAVAYCDDLELDGVGWRLPTVMELVSIADYGAPPWADAFGELPEQAVFWSSLPRAKDDAEAWTVDFAGGQIGYGEKSATWPSRCVRGEASSSTRYTAEGDTVADALTGLRWQAGDLASGGWLEALAQCEALELGGHDDWRLPSVKELVTIVDFARGAPAVAPELEFGLPAGGFWSSTPAHGAPGDAFAVDFFDGLAIRAASPTEQLVRCVRGPEE